MLQSAANIVTKCVSFSLLQSEANIVTFCGSSLCYKVRQKLLQSGAVVTKWSKYCYKVRQLLQSGAIVTKWGITPSTESSVRFNIVFLVNPERYWISPLFSIIATTSNSWGKTSRRISITESRWLKEWSMNSHLSSEFSLLQVIFKLN